MANEILDRLTSRIHEALRNSELSPDIHLAQGESSLQHLVMDFMWELIQQGYPEPTAKSILESACGELAQQGYLREKDTPLGPIPILTPRGLEFFLVNDKVLN